MFPGRRIWRSRGGDPILKSLFSYPATALSETFYRSNTGIFFVWEKNKL